MRRARGILKSIEASISMNYVQPDTTCDCIDKMRWVFSFIAFMPLFDIVNCMFATVMQVIQVIQVIHVVVVVTYARSPIADRRKADRVVSLAKTKF